MEITCFTGVLIQLVFYGVTSSWLLAAVTLIFIQMQSYAEKYKSQNRGAHIFFESEIKLCA